MSTTDRIRERHAEGLERVQSRLDAIDAELPQQAARYWPELIRGRPEFTGAARRVLTDLLLERLCLVAVRDAHDLALEEALAEESKRREHEDRVERPKREAQAKWDAARLAERETDARIQSALGRVRASRPSVRPPDPEDIALLRKHAHAGEVVQLLWQVDHSPWWRTNTNTNTNTKGPKP